MGFLPLYLASASHAAASFQPATGQAAGPEVCGLPKELREHPIGPTKHTISAKTFEWMLTNPNLPNGNQGIDIRDTTVRGSVNLTERTIPHLVSLNNVHFTGSVIARGATFMHGLELRRSVVDGEANLANVDSHGPFLLRASIFHRGLDLSSARIRGMLSLRASTFDKDADIERMRIDGGMLTQYARFYGPVDASHMAIKGTLTGQNSCFIYPSADVDNPSVSWSYTVIDGSAVLKHSRIRTPVEFDNLIVRGLLDLHGAVMAHDPIVADPKDVRPCRENGCQPLDFEGLRVEGAATFHAAALQGCVVLDHAEFQAIDLFIQPKLLAARGCGPSNNPARPFSVDGLSYKQVLGGSETIRRMTDLFYQLPTNDHPERAQQAFKQLEAVVASQGDSDDANSVYIAGQHWQGKQIWATPVIGVPWAAARGLGDLYIGFGRRPSQALGICLAIAVGAAILQFWAPQQQGLIRGYMLVGAAAFAILIFYIVGGWPVFLSIVASLLAIPWLVQRLTH